MVNLAQGQLITCSTRHSQLSCDELTDSSDDIWDEFTSFTKVFH